MVPKPMQRNRLTHENFLFGFLEILPGRAVKTAVQRHAINPNRLKLELTEVMLLESIEETIAAMNALNQTSVQFSPDDFGAGCSFLQYLKRLPPSQFKIDHS
jgi:EAL domain-containing protein (putative c-di-GMP-specific phosphodiesterase class I)